MKTPTGKAATRVAKRVRHADPAVGAVFDAYPKPVKARLLALRRLIFDTARATMGVGALQETLKWGQPSYLTPETKSGSTIRIDQVRPVPGQYAVYFHCQSSAKAGDPVRRGFSVLSCASLEYWVARSSRAMTPEYVFVISRRIAPEVCG